jgi:hypothetical protein
MPARDAVAIAAMCLALVLGASPIHAQTADEPVKVTNEYRITIFPHYPIKGSLSGFGYIGWVKNPELDYQLYYASAPGVIYKVKPWLQSWNGVLLIYTNNDTAVTGKQDTVELRPFVGGKFFLPNKMKWNIYNFTRLEFRETYHHDTHAWTHTQRLRMRFGVEIPLTSREKAWTLGSLYAVANVEPLYRFDRDEIDPARVQFGLGWVMNERIRPELLYYLNWGRTDPGHKLRYNENIIRLNIKVGVNRALLGHVWNPGPQ